MKKEKSKEEAVDLIIKEAESQLTELKDELKTILITSILHKEGKSFVSSNLAISYAKSGKKVLLLDADMSNGDQYERFDVSLTPGLSNYLLNSDIEKSNIEELIQETTIENLSIITSGDAVQNSSELLVSNKMTKLLEQLKRNYDIIIFDSTPSLLETDAIILSRLVDATLIVTTNKKVKTTDITKVEETIQNVGGLIAGIVQNKIPRFKKQHKIIKTNVEVSSVRLEEEIKQEETNVGASSARPEEEIKQEETNVGASSARPQEKIKQEKIDVETANSHSKRKKKTTTKKTTKATKTAKTAKKSTKKADNKEKNTKEEKETKKRKTKQPDRSKDILKQINKYLDTK